MPLVAKDEPSTRSRGFMCSWTRRDRRARDLRRGGGPAAVANAHSAVPARSDRGADHDDCHRPAGLNLTGDRDRAGDLDLAPDRAGDLDLAVNHFPDPGDAPRVRTAARLPNPKRLLAVVAAGGSSAACRLCPDWSDHDPPFR